VDQTASRCEGGQGAAGSGASNREFFVADDLTVGSVLSTPRHHAPGEAARGRPIAMIGDTHQAVCQWSKANGYRLAGPRWEIYGDPDPSSGHFDVQVFWSLVTP
jgi:hypothetical protein